MRVDQFAEIIDDGIMAFDGHNPVFGVNHEPRYMRPVGISLRPGKGSAPFVMHQQICRGPSGRAIPRDLQHGGRHVRPVVRDPSVPSSKLICAAGHAIFLGRKAVKHPVILPLVPSVPCFCVVTGRRRPPVPAALFDQIAIA